MPRVDMGDYNRAVVEELREKLATGFVPGLTPEKVYLEGTGSLAEIVIIFRYETHPNCRFGYRFPTRMEPGTDPSDWAIVAAANIDEMISASDSAGLPDDCPPGAITWID